MHDLESNEAHRKAQWLAYQKHLAEVEELRALERACELAVQEVSVLRGELLDAQLDRQRAELAWRAVHLARQTELLDSFRSGLRTIIVDIAGPLQIIRVIKQKLKPRPCEAIDWTTFNAAFGTAYPAFQSKLAGLYPELTDVELKICELLKLNMTSADIGTLVCISERKVREHHNRIRRKMGLLHNDALYKVFAGL